MDGDLPERPRLRAELLRTAVAADEVWGEWRWLGTRVNGALLDVRGVTILGVRGDRIIWGRFYLEEAGAGGGGMQAESPG